MTLDNTARKLADNLINRFGKTVTLRRVTRTAYNGATGVGGDNNLPVDYTVKVSPPTDFMFKKIDGTLIKEGDQVVSIAALNAPIVPYQETDSVFMDVDGVNEEWKIRQLGRLWSGELVATYILHLTQ